MSESSSLKNLQGKHIILGICGGIAAYKSAYLARLLVKAGAEVQVVMTPSAKEFITPLTMSTLTGKPVVSEFFTANTGEWHSHVSLGIWADMMIVAPATASSLAKMANGIADNMLITTYLSLKPGVKVLLAPAMDLDMMAHPSTARNLRLLTTYGCEVAEPGTGELASHLCGKGRMAEPEDIAARADSLFMPEDAPLTGRKVLVTAGPTYEKIDPVRFIGNFSTGKMGYAIALAAAEAGAKVSLVSGPTTIPAPVHPLINVIKVESAVEMLAACESVFPETDYSVMTAAVADYAPAERAELKIKREHTPEICLTLKANPDIAATLGASKQPGQRVVGFALETNNGLEHARQKLVNKHLDMVVLNTLQDSGAGFGVDTNRVSFVYPDGSVTEFPLKSKTDVARDIVEALPAL